jgi:NAD(P) transhydrogenase
MFAALGVKVTLLDQRPTLLDFVDREIMESLCFQLRQLGMVLRVGEKVVLVGFDAERDKVFATLESGKKIRGQALLYAIGRHANSDKMKIEAAGLAADERGKLAVNENFQTAVPHIYAAGDVIGFPALARYFDGAGAACELSHVRQAQPAAVESDSVWHLHHSGNIDGRRHRGRVDAQQDSV